MKRTMALTALGTLLTTATFAAPIFPGSALLGKKSALVPREGATFVFATRDANTALLRLGMKCERRSASIREVSAGGVRFKGRNTGAWTTSDAVGFREVRVTVVPTGIGRRDADCTLSLYDGSDRSYEQDSLTTGAINYVNFNNQNQLMIRDCLQKQVARALQDHGLASASAKVWLPPMGGNDARELVFRVDATDGDFNGQNYTFELVLLAGERWAYSSFGGSIGPVGISSWSYQAKSMSRLGYLLAGDGSAQPLLRADVGACWTN